MVVQVPAAFTKWHAYGRHALKRASPGLWAGHNMETNLPKHHVRLFSHQLAGGGGNWKIVDASIHAARYTNSALINLQDLSIPSHKCTPLRKRITSTAASACETVVSRPKPSTTQPPKKGSCKGGVLHTATGGLQHLRAANVSDPRDWGRMAGAIYGCTRSVRKQRKALAVLTVYGPVYSTAANSMWASQKRHMARLPAGTAKSNPALQFLDDLEQLCKRLQRKYHCNIVIQGDFNISLDKACANTTALKATLRSLHLYDAFSKLHPGCARPDTWVQNPSNPTSPRAPLDYTFVSSVLFNRGAITRFGVLAHEVISGDHRASCLEINLPLAIATDIPAPASFARRKRVFKFVNKAHLKTMRRNIRKSWLESRLHASICALTRTANLHGLEWRKRANAAKPPDAAAASFMARMQATMSLAEKCLRGAEDQLAAALPVPSAKRKNCVSSAYLNRAQAFRRMHGLIRLARTPLTAPGGKAAAASITSCLAAHDIHTPSAGYAPATAEPWCDAAEQGVRVLQKTLHGKQREKDRYRYDPANKHSIIKRLEKARASCSDSATFWATARHKSKFSAPQQSLVLPRPGYETKVVTEPAEFLEVERDHITKHMAGTASPWTMSPDNQQHPIAPLNSAGRRYRRRLAKHGAGASDVPVQFRGIFKHAKRLPMPAADRQAAELIFTTPIPFARFEAYTAGKKKNRGPGKSEIRIDHICAAPKGAREDICSLLSIPYTTGLVYTSWNAELINWIPKEEGNPDINKRRPIALLEVMRKICMGIKKQEMFDIWIRNGFINPDNYAFLKGKSTSLPILITKAMLEDSKFNKTELHTMQVDLKRAYDMVPYYIKEMALRRLGLPEAGISLWCAFDTTRQLQVVTPHGLTEPIHPQCGAFAQGGEESCMGFVSLMSWMSDYIDSKFKGGYRLPTGDGTSALTGQQNAVLR